MSQTASLSITSSYLPDAYEHFRVEPHRQGGISYGSHVIIRTFGRSAARPVCCEAKTCVPGDHDG